MDEEKRKNSGDVPFEILDRCIPCIIMSSIWNVSRYRTLRKYLKSELWSWYTKPPTPQFLSR
jgi:hypothetical protein